MGQHGILNNTGPPTRHEPASVLRARASEYQRMGARASSTRDARDSTIWPYACLNLRMSASLKNASQHSNSTR